MIKTEERFDITYLDQSSVSTFHRCPAKYMFERLMGLKQPDASTMAPDYGTDIHRALPYCYASIADRQACIKRAVEEFKRGWDARAYGEEDDKRNSMRAYTTLLSFMEKNSAEACPYEVLHFDNLTAPTAEKVSDNEVPFLIDIGGPLPAKGRIDCIVRWKSTGDIWVLDYKTASEISNRYFSNFWFAPQPCLYTMAGCQITGERVKGMIIEALRVSKVNTETTCQMIFVQDHEIQSSLAMFNRKAKQILEFNAKGEWPKESVGCSCYASHHHAGRTCEYKLICEQPDWREGVRFYERHEPFDPFKVS